MANKAKSVYSHDLRDPLEVPLSGNLHSQPEHSKNTLLAKAGLGQVKHTTYDLPSAKDFQHEYGLRLVSDGVTSNEVLGSWAVHDGTADQMPPRDFKALNKMAASSGLTTSAAFAQFREENDARVKQGTSTKPIPLGYDKLTTTFGRSTAPDTPMMDLMSHSYRFEWAETAPSAAEMHAARRPKAPSQTKTSILNAKVSHAKVAALQMKEELEAKYASGDAFGATNTDGQPLWKMRSFGAVPSKVGYLG